MDLEQLCNTPRMNTVIKLESAKYSGFVKLGSRFKVYLKSLRDLDLERVAIIAMHN